MILILGASGYIGNYCFNRFNDDNHPVLGTYSKNKKEGMVHFDLSNMDINNIDLEDKIKTLIICSAVNTKIDESKEKFVGSYYTNVTRLKFVLDYCQNKNIKTIFISTDNVFDGKKGNYSENDERNPINCYGKMKYEIENYLLNHNNHLLLRVGRVFGVKDDTTLFTSFLNKMKNDKKIVCFNDQLFTPLYIEELYNFLKFSINKDIKGVYHLASTKPITHLIIADKIRGFFNLSDIEIESKSIDSFNFLDNRPKKTDLNISKYKSLMGFEEKNIEYYLEKFKIN